MSGQQIIRLLESPIKATGHLQILYGNLAPEGCVGKITGKEGLQFEGEALCFDCEEDMLSALADNAEPFRVSSPIRSHSVESYIQLRQYQGWLAG